MPTFIKDLPQLEGVETTWGSGAARGHVSKKSDPIVRRIRTAPVMLTRRFDTRKVESLTSGLARTFTRAPLATARATRRLRRIAAEYAKVFERYDVLVSPTLAELPPRLGWISTDAQPSAACP